MEKSAAEVQTKEQYNQEIPHKRGKETKSRKNREHTNGGKGRTIEPSETTQTGERDEE
jgi:hypothetical protein